jgi:hypothetical protein
VTCGAAFSRSVSSPQHQVPELPDGFWYTAKRSLLGPPLVTEQLTSQRLSKPLALGVLSCDGLSSAAYGTEEISTRCSRSSAWPPSRWYCR